MTITAIKPQSGPQEAFLACNADIAGYGGAAGSGKTAALLMEPLRHSGNGGFGAVIFRRTSEDIRNEGALWDSSYEFYASLGKPREVNLDWTFPSGASIGFKGLQYEKDIYNFQGAQICFMGWDELTHFTRKQFFYMMSRNRSTCGVRPYIRFTLNPDPDSWVFELLAPWVDEESPHYGAEPGEIRWFINENDELQWVPVGTPDAKSISYFPATIFDNKILLEKDPGYLTNLRVLSFEDQQRLLHGKWNKLEARGALWSRSNIERDRIQLNEAPKMERTVIALDPAATNTPESDETGIIVRAKGTDNHFYTLADRSGRYQPEDWARIAIQLYHRYDASCIVAESNQGGEMIRAAIHAVERVPVKLEHAVYGKEVRAEPVAVLSSMGKDHHVGAFPALEGEQTRWVPGQGMASPNRIDAYVLGTMELDPTIAKPKTNLKPRAGRYV